MYNIALYFEGTRTSGSFVPLIPRTFTIVSDNKESTSVSAINKCEIQNQWNAWLCNNNNIGVMIFDNKDADRMDRAL